MPLALNAIRTHAEVAQIMTERGHALTRAAVWRIEQQALDKLAQHPLILSLALEIGLSPPRKTP